MKNNPISNRPSGQGGKPSLAARITKAGSRQTYFTFRCLADRERVKAGFQAYAYFRWLDDLLDCTSGTAQGKAELLERQMSMLDACYRREAPGEVTTEEQMLVDLVQADLEEHSGLQIYLRNMMQVMAFDVARCGRLVSQAELDEYSRLLSSAVTELMYYLFGHDHSPAPDNTRYHAVFAAHIVHMLRDLVEDIEVGYFNLPSELVRAGMLSPEQVNSLAFRKWVFSRVALAHKYFQLGRQSIARAKSFRCRLAGYAYIARFEWMLRAIERDQYSLRRDYPERKSFKALVWMVWRVCSSTVKLPELKAGSGEQSALSHAGRQG